MSNLLQDKVYIFIGFILAICIKLIWVYQFYDYAPFQLNNSFILTTNDGYFYLQEAKELFEGNLSKALENYSALAYVTLILSKIFFLTLDQVAFYLPIILSALLVFPVFQLAKRASSGSTFVGLSAAIFATTALSYYNRTMVGYYDTDIMTVVFVYIVSYYFLLLYFEAKFLHIVKAVIWMFLGMLWYQKILIVLAPVFLLASFFYFKKNNDFYYKLILYFLICFVPVAFYIKLLLLFLAYLLFKSISIQRKYFLGFILVAFFFGVAFKGGSHIIERISAYFLKEELVSTMFNSEKVFFFEAQNTVREAGGIPFETVVKRISTTFPLFILGAIGLCALVFNNKKIWLIFTPLVAVGVLSSIGGLRFTVFAVPIFAIGLFYLLNQLVLLIGLKGHYKNVLLTISSLVCIGFNIGHIKDYKVPTVINHTEARQLVELKKIINKNDYLLSWWDYSYHLKYFADASTIIDGGIHTGEHNFLTSLALTTPSPISARLFLLETFYDEKRKSIPLPYKSNILNFLADYQKQELKSFYPLLFSQPENLKPSKDVYLYLPYRMLEIFATVEKFSAMDLKTGEAKTGLFYQSVNFSQDKNLLHLGNNIVVDQQNGFVFLNNQKVKLKVLQQTELKNDQKTYIMQRNFHQDGGLFVIHMKNYNKILLLDEKMYNSTFIQLFVLGAKTKEYELVSSTGYAKVYKINKIY